MAAAEYELLREHGFCIFASVTGTRYDELKGHFFWSLLLHLYS